jgi:hypothetical protein
MGEFSPVFRKLRAQNPTVANQLTRLGCRTLENLEPALLEVMANSIPATYTVPTNL